MKNPQPASASRPRQPVQAARQELTIPMTPVRRGRLPLLGRLNPNRVIHPYRLLTEIQFGQMRDRAFRALTLENEFLRLTVLPELGGRLHRAVYKPANYDLFYNNDAIRTQLVSSRGAWYAGGVEFNFPVSHSLITCAGVEHDLQQYPDGSAAAIVSNTDSVSHMRWRVAIRIYPGRNVIHFQTRLINRTAWPQRYYYWLNAAVPQGPQIRYHFAASRLIGHLQDVDGVQTRLDSFPVLRNGSDARVPAKLSDTTSIFMLDNHSGFFGYYDVDADLGLVRSAPVRSVPGNKIWSWGDTDYGRRFNRRLVPPGAQDYGELQSGRPESQTDWAIIEPFEVIDADEYWYPIPGLGDMTDGSGELTVLSKPKEGRIRAVSNRPFEQLRVRVLQRTLTSPRRLCDPPLSQREREKVLVEKAFADVRTGEPVELTMPATDQPIRLEASDSAGRIVYEHRDLAEPPESIICDLYEHKATAARKPANTAGQRTVRGLTAYRANEPVEAEQYFRAALKLEPDFGPAHRWLGFLLRLRGCPAEAEKHFKAALLADPMDYAAFYEYAAILLETGQLDRAAMALERVIGYAHGQYRVWAAVLLVRCLLQQGRPDAARQVMNDWPQEVACGPLGRLAFQFGLAPDGQSRWWNDSTDLVERIVRSNDVPATLNDWWSRNVKDADEAADFVQEAALELLDASDRQRAAATLDWLAGHPVLGSACPMAHCRLGQLRGDLEAAAKRAGQRTDRDNMAWPGRLADEPLLEQVCQAAPDDALAHSLLGMARLWLGKAADAVGSLKRATELNDTDALAWRNLALAHWTLAPGWDHPEHVDDSPQAVAAECLAAYERAIALWPDYTPLIAEADRMLARGGPSQLPRRRKLLYDQLHLEQSDGEVIAVRRAELSLFTGDYRAGLAELDGRQFFPGEGRFGTQRLFTRLNLLEGERLAAQGAWAEAAERFRRALVYPDNIGIGRTGRAQESRPLFLLALALEELGDAAGSRAKLEQLAESCLRSAPVEAFFGILAQRKLGREQQADRWLAELEHVAVQRAGNLTQEGQRWAKVAAAMAARARGQRERSNEMLAEFKPLPTSELADYLASRLY